MSFEVEGGVNDPRLGPLDVRSNCRTCDESAGAVGGVELVTGAWRNDVFLPSIWPFWRLMTFTILAKGFWSSVQVSNISCRPQIRKKILGWWSSSTYYDYYVVPCNAYTVREDFLTVRNFQKMLNTSAWIQRPPPEIKTCPGHWGHLTLAKPMRGTRGCFSFSAPKILGFWLGVRQMWHLNTTRIYKNHSANFFRQCGAHVESWPQTQSLKTSPHCWQAGLVGVEFVLAHTESWDWTTNESKFHMYRCNIVRHGAGSKTSPKTNTKKTRPWRCWHPAMALQP